VQVSACLTVLQGVDNSSGVGVTGRYRVTEMSHQNVPIKFTLKLCIR
jgi:hypothetical protein